MSTSDNARIAKNTLALYVRMIFAMAVTFYTSRVILQALGVVDFGVYNVVGGVVTLFGFINGSLSGASARFITYALGEGDEKELQRIVNCVVTIHYLIAAVIFLLAETIGLWFVVTKLVIPAGRAWAAFWVYQSTIVAAVVMLISTPFNALIIAHERMGAFAYISILEVLAKLGIVLLLFVIPYDRLIAYAILLVTVQIIIRSIYTLYCRRHFLESHYRLVWDKKRSREIFSYAGWAMNGYLAVVGFTQGINILLNLFFGPAVNAARGIAVQVQGGISSFFGNFQVAVNPQITKSWARGEIDYMHNLVLRSSRFSFYLMLLVSLPVFLKAEYILQLWLGQVPEHTVNFVRVMLLTGLNGTFSGPTIMAIHATGRIKRFQAIEGTMLLTVVPVAYLLLKFCHISPEGVFITYIVIEILTQLARVHIVYPAVQMPRHRYLTHVLWPCAKVSLAASIPTYILYRSLPSLLPTASPLVSFLLITLASLLITCAAIALFGLSQHERTMMWEKAKGTVKRKGRR